jgi:hypothetical protein
MFGHGSKYRHAEERSLAVDTTLEGDLTDVEQSIQSFLANPTENRRKELRTVLEQLDDQTDSSDYFSENVIGSGALGYATKFSVIGETSPNPIAEDVPATVFQAQIALVKAAKDAVVEQTESRLIALRKANEALETLRALTKTDQ